MSCGGPPGHLRNSRRIDGIRSAKPVFPPHLRRSGVTLRGNALTGVRNQPQGETNGHVMRVEVCASSRHGRPSAFFCVISWPGTVVVMLSHALEAHSGPLTCTAVTCVLA